MSGETTVQFVRRCRHCGEPLSTSSSFCSKCGATAEPVGPSADALRDQLCELFGQDLEIERELGRGGMAAVYGAYDPALQRRVAVKVLLPEIANDRSAADRFLREARTVASLQHPHVVTVYAVRSRAGVHAIVMQFVEGRSLDAVLNEQGVIPAHVAGLLIAQAADGLQHAHDRGVIHRDVKPANVLIDREGRAVVSDFGIARRESGPRTTDTGYVVGTWAYMSPEQRSADAITPATDQYALGVMAFELLTGQLPFNGTASEMLRAHLHEPPPSLRAINPAISEGMEAVVHRMLAKLPADRYPSLREPERAFRALIADEGKTTMQLAAFSHMRPKAGSQVLAAAGKAPPRAAPPRPPAPRGSADSPTIRVSDIPPPAAARQAAAPAPARRGSPALIGAGVGVALLGALWFFTRGGSPSSSPPAKQPVTLGAQSTPAQPAPSPAPATKTPADQPRQQASAPSGAGTRPANGSSSRGNDAIAPSPITQSRSGAAPSGGSPPVDTSPRTSAQPDRAAQPAAKADAAPAAPAAPTLAATRDTARRIGREFVTMLNQLRARDVAQIPQLGGDAAARQELIRLIDAGGFAAGYDRIPGTPAEWTNGIAVDFDLDLEWRGGKKVMRVTLYATPSGSSWRVVGMAVQPAG